MSNGGYILDDRGFPKFVGGNVPVWKQEVDAFGNPVRSNASGGGSCIGWIAILFVLIPAAIISALTSFISALPLKLYIRKIEIEYKILSFKDALELLFKTTLLYQVLNIVVGLVLYWLLKDKMQLFFYTLQNASKEELVVKVVVAAIVLQIPSSLFTAIFLQKKLSYYSKFKGFAGYLRAFLFTIAIITPILCVAAWLVWSAASFYLIISRAIFSTGDPAVISHYYKRAYRYRKINGVPQTINDA